MGILPLIRLLAQKRSLALCISIWSTLWADGPRWTQDSALFCSGRKECYSRAQLAGCFLKKMFDELRGRGCYGWCDMENKYGSMHHKWTYGIKPGQEWSHECAIKPVAHLRYVHHDYKYKDDVALSIIVLFLIRKQKTSWELMSKKKSYIHGASCNGSDFGIINILNIVIEVF